MSSTKTRLRELERGNQRFEVILTSLSFDTGGMDASEATRTATLHCNQSAYAITRRENEDAGAFARRAEAEAITLARVDHPKAICLAPGAGDL
tara:strand:- start:117 stop:395 length:279 start_codon:yes stop_codon:yes gene_type:complete